MNTYKIYCGGSFRETARSLEIRSPYSDEVAGRTWLAGKEELEDAISAALQALAPMAGLSSFEKSEILIRIRDGLREKRQEMAEIICLESGKPLRYALAETDRSIQTFQVASEECKRLPAEYVPIDWTPAGKGREGLLRYFPIGLVAGISPFNFPLNLAVHKIAPAIAAGCPIILKPSSSTPLATLTLASILHQSGLPAGAVSILPMDRETGNQLVTDDRISLLSFTGSPAVGWKMKQQAWKKKVVLELGGNAGVIISATANLDEAIPKCVSGGFSYSGQVCIHTQRIYVDAGRFDEFVLRFTEGVGRLKQGDPLDPDTEISVMIDEDNAIRVEDWVREAVENGATLLAGGKRSGAFMPPTVLTGTKPDMKVCCEEVFGPVVVLEKVSSLKEAVARINEGCFGLQAGVFTDSIAEMNQAFRHLEVGGIIINDVPTFRVDHMPYGGVKDSGQGREGVKYAMMDMLEPRLLVKNQ